VQVGWQEGKAKILGVWEIAPEMKAGNVVFRRVYKTGAAALEKLARKRA
jgi:hypothetical protein